MENKKVVLITGCSSGIGRGLCEVLTAKGYSVAATARKPQSLNGLQVALKLPLDVTRPESIKEAMDEIMARLGRLDILINNAGYAIRGALEEVSGESIKQMFDVNVFGICNMVRAVVPVMWDNPDAKIVNIGSISGRFAQPVNGAYCASKFAVEALTEALRLELYSRHIQVTVIEPGPVGTEFFKTSVDNSTTVMDNPKTHYASLYRTSADFMKSQKMADPLVVCRTIAGIIGKQTLKPRYMVAVPYRSRMLTRFSDSLKEFCLKSGYKIS